VLDTLRATSNQVPHPFVTGRNVAHARRCALERAFLAADLHLGRISLVTPTIKQAATMLMVSQAYVTAAKAIAYDEKARNAVISGRVPLLVAAWSESLSDHYLRASPAERVNLTQTAGVDHLFDELIVPAL
jgi:hypothetical protein